MTPRQLNFWGTWENSKRIADALLETGRLRAFVDGPSSRPKVDWHDKLDPQFWATIKKRGGVCLSVRGTDLPAPAFEQWDSGEYAGQYYVSGGGPFIEFATAPDYRERGRHVIGSGRLTCATTLYDSLSGRELRTPSDVMGEYEECARTLKSLCARFGPRRRWVGLRAIELLKDGSAQVTDLGF